jgi:tetratricopeptide (TPR) repeat protein
MKIRLILLICFCVGFSQNPDSLFQAGISLLNSGNNERAVNHFETILSQGYHHENLYYNLGNAYYKLGNYGQSIWAYEKAIALNPLDKDSGFNLDLANTHVQDRINVPESFFLLKWYRVLKSILTLSQFLILSSFCVLVLALYYLSSKLFYVNLRGFIIQFMLFITLILHGITLDKYWDKSDNKKAIITAKELNAFSGPFIRDDAVLFKIHEGIKVTIDSEQGDWVEISLLDGKKGWVLSEQLRIL